MKNILYILLAVFLFGCSKEDSLTQKLEYENLYVIEDDPSDPVKHQVYEIYQRYNVPVYFNDTIGKTLIKKDIHGISIYQYETLDLPWSFTSYSSLDYQYEYMTDAEEQLKALHVIENYLALVSKRLYPFNFFVVKSYTTKDGNDNVEKHGNGEYQIHIRTLLMTGDWANATIDDLPADMMRQMVKNKISNYQTLLTEFNSISKAAWYGVSYASLNPNHFEDLVSPNEFGWSGYGGIPPQYYFAPSCFPNTWWGCSEFTPEGLENFRTAVRKKIGLWGFVSSGRVGTYTPDDREKDLVAFISEMLSLSREEFEEKWGISTLVMQKYEILYEIVANELGVEL